VILKHLSYRLKIFKKNYLTSLVTRLFSYDCLNKLNDSELKEKIKITRLIEHPVQMKPPTQSDKKVIPAVMLTAKERKKMRRQNRAEALKEEQEKIRLGLLAPPEPKGNLINLIFL
jgi:U4/U6 small nuclear ribonucleoprotein PRP3